jgi:hypothetical protein
LAHAVETKVADFLGRHADLKTAEGYQRVIRRCHLPEREVMTGIGPVSLRQPGVRDHEADATEPDRIRFSPSILPPYMRGAKSTETLLPILLPEEYLDRRLLQSAGCLKDATGLSSFAIGRLKYGGLDKHTAWQKRDLQRSGQNGLPVREIESGKLPIRLSEKWTLYKHRLSRPRFGGKRPISRVNTIYEAVPPFLPDKTGRAHQDFSLKAHHAYCSGR